jgi:hypothetical protein
VTDRSIFTGVSGPSSDAGDPASPIILGHIFQVALTCWVKAIRFWRGTTAINGVQKGRIFAVGTQSIVSGTAVDFPALSGTGWQVATLPAPVQLTANTSYKACVHFTDNYSATGGYWATGPGVGGRTDGPLTAPDAGGAPLGLGPVKQGSFAVTSNPDTYPDSYFNGGNYWVDLIAADVDPNAGQTITLGLPVETSSALGVTLAKTLDHALPTEVDTAVGQTLGKTVDLTLPVALDSALAVSLAKGVTVGLPVETVSALPVALGKGVLLGRPVEVDSALPLLVNDVWPPSVQPPVNKRWAVGQPPVTSRWASSRPPRSVPG